MLTVPELSVITPTNSYYDQEVWSVQKSLEVRFKKYIFMVMVFKIANDCASSVITMSAREEFSLWNKWRHLEELPRVRDVGLPETLPQSSHSSSMAGHLSD